MQPRREQQHRINRSITEKETGMKKTLVVVACLVLSLVCAHSNAYAWKWFEKVQIVELELSPVSDDAVKILVDKDDPYCPSGHVILKDSPKYKEALSVLLTAAAGRKRISFWTVLDPSTSGWRSAVCTIQHMILHP